MMCQDDDLAMRLELGDMFDLVVEPDKIRGVYRALKELFREKSSLHGPQDGGQR